MLGLWASLCGCGNGNVAPSPDLGMDLAMMASPDLSALASPIGGPCASTADCIEGTTPVCFTKTLYNKGGFLKTQGGYCSSKCTTDDDCGVNGVCQDEGTNGKWCFASCTNAAGCLPGYACIYSGEDHCFPNGSLTCDPTNGDGTCTTATNQVGGCFRYAHGTGLTGYCYDGCDVGAGSCPVQGGFPQQCNVYDERSFKDLEAKTGDKFVGGVCIQSYSLNPAGTECLDNGADSIDACVDGAECDLAAAFAGVGDNLCHTLCLAGTGAPDAGTTCTLPATCHDVWGLFGTAQPVGLCLQ